MKRIVSAILIVCCLSVGASGALAAPPLKPVVPASPGAPMVCTMGGLLVSQSTLTLPPYKLSPVVASRVMAMLVSIAARFPRAGVTCTSQPVLVS